MDPALTLSVEERILRLEGKLGWRDFETKLSASSRLAALGLIVLGLIFSLLGVGLPNHYYQPVLALLTILFCYHRHFLARPKVPLDWLLVVLNVCCVSCLYKLLIGMGVCSPFSWLRYPVIKSGSPGEGSWIPSIPSWTLSWEPTPISLWSIDLTIVQTFLVLVTLLGSLVEFQPFASFTAFFLLLVSIPALSDFNWPFVFPALVCVVVGLYVQSPSMNEKA